MSVKHENFKTCAQSGFCTRNRAYADEAARQSTSWSSPYALDPSTLRLQDGSLTGKIFKTINSTTAETVTLPITITLLKSGNARVTIDEEKRQKGEIELRHGSKARKERYNDADSWVLVGGLEPNRKAKMSSEGQSTRVTFGKNGEHDVVITHNPFGLDFKRNGETQMKVNDRGLLNVEHWRPKIDAPEKPATEKSEEEKTDEATPETVSDKPDESTWWDEPFGGNTDSKPRGPESLGLDVTFTGYEHVYGIPEHTGPLSLKETRYGPSYVCYL